MTATGARGETPEESPTPRRIGKRSWLNPRVIGGILLVVAAVVIGARVVGASSQTTPVWAAQHALAVGTVLTANDLIAVEVNLGDSGGRYLAATDVPVGRLLSVSVGVGELLPVGALGTAGAGRIVVIPVATDAMPPGIGHGSQIDLYLTVPGAAGASAPTETRLLQGNLTVQSVTSPSSGGLSGASANQYQLAVLLGAERADELVRTLPTGEAIVVLITGGGG